MTRLAWGAPSERQFETGLDRGVLYPKNVPPGTIALINRVPNPTIAVDIANYGGTAAVNLSRDTTWAPLGALKLSATGTSNDSYAHVAGDVGSIRLGMEAGKTYTVSADGYVPVVQTGTLHAQTRKIAFYYKQGAGAYQSVVSSPAPIGSSARVSVTLTLPSDTTEAFVRLYNGSGVAGEVVFWDNILVNEGTNILYFDGSFPDDNYSYEWAGGVNNSISIKRLIEGTAVAWNGLTSVDEGGGEGAASYYIDGRPFLFLPKPKEFTATLKALTYPDAFAAIQGVAEAADGMYLDSQQGDAFDLSYRTLVGDGDTGTERGYKIHLIYNATVVPEGVTYVSLSDNINPTEFGWQIQAVPVPVDGYRPTAHIIIDTRHMDAVRLASIEALLYGTDTLAVSGIPSPQVIFDILSFGDAIIITDNGDGTWRAEGSYENIYMIGDEIFQIDNVNATDLGDGSYTISSTP